MIPGRIVLIAMVMLGLYFALFLFVASSGYWDLPPGQPGTAAERFCNIALAVVSWPLSAAAWALRDDPGAFALPLCLLGLLFWAVLIEGLLTVTNARWI